MDLKDIVRDQLKRHLIGRRITCDVTGEVLDIRTAVFIVDRDGDPAIPVSPAGWDQRKELMLEGLLARGYSIDDPREPK